MELDFGGRAAKPTQISNPTNWFRHWSGDDRSFEWHGWQKIPKGYGMGPTPGGFERRVGASQLSRVSWCQWVFPVDVGWWGFPAGFANQMATHDFSTPAQHRPADQPSIKMVKDPQ